MPLTTQSPVEHDPCMCKHAHSLETGNARLLPSVICQDIDDPLAILIQHFAHALQQIYRELRMPSTITAKPCAILQLTRTNHIAPKTTSPTAW